MYALGAGIRQKLCVLSAVYLVHEAHVSVCITQSVVNFDHLTEDVSARLPYCKYYFFTFCK